MAQMLYQTDTFIIRKQVEGEQPPPPGKPPWEKPVDQWELGDWLLVGGIGLGVVAVVIFLTKG